MLLEHTTFYSSYITCYRGASTLLRHWSRSHVAAACPRQGSNPGLPPLGS